MHEKLCPSSHNCSTVPPYHRRGTRPEPGSVNDCWRGAIEPLRPESACVEVNIEITKIVEPRVEPDEPAADVPASVLLVGGSTLATTTLHQTSSCKLQLVTFLHLLLWHAMACAVHVIAHAHWHCYGMLWHVAVTVVLNFSNLGKWHGN